LLAESYILIAEELLMCKPSQDAVHCETGEVIVHGDDIMPLINTYYENAKDKLQDIGEYFNGMIEWYF
jgi:hypothetical protein